MGEITLIVDAYNQKQEDETKLQLALDYQLASNTAYFIGSVLNGKQIPSLKKIYPSLFDDEVEQKEVKSSLIMKELLIDFAIKHNKMRGDKSK